VLKNFWSFKVGDKEPQRTVCGDGALFAVHPVQIMKCCNVYVAGVGNLYFILSEALFCIPTRSVLLALFARLMLQAEVPGLDAGKPSSLGSGQESSGHADQCFSQSCAFFKAQKTNAVS